jgi:hypothetical protein
MVALEHAAQLAASAQAAFEDSHSMFVSDSLSGWPAWSWSDTSSSGMDRFTSIQQTS